MGSEIEGGIRGLSAVLVNVLLLDLYSCNLSINFVKIH